MAALRKSGEEEWKKRNAATQLLNQQQQQQQQQPAAETNESNSISVKQQQNQLKQQLQGMSGFKPMPKLNLSSELKRAILAPLNDNIDNEEENKPRHSLKHDESTNDNNNESSIPHSEKREKRLPPGAKIIFNPSDLNADLEKALLKNKNVNKNRAQTTALDTDSMPKSKSVPESTSQQHLLNERVELFSTDSEMDSFFKENDSKNYKYNDLFSSSSAVASPQNGDLENDDEFDRIVSEAQR